MWALSAGLTVAGLGCGGLAAQMKSPDWLRRPSPQELLAVYPREAMQRGLSGSATISCIVTAQGGLRNCEVASEKPAGAGFGAAALALSPQFLLRPATRDGVPVESVINVPIRFEWDDRTATTFIHGGVSTKGPGFVREYPGPLAWSQAPSVADLLAAYPPKARDKKAGGRASLDCKFTAAGRLADCRTLAEEPLDMGFARAAKLLADRFQGPTQDAEGQPMGGAHTQLAFAFPALARDTDTPPIGKPRWTAIPQARDLATVLPAQAKAAGVLQASVVLQCSVAADGGLTACAVQAETPGDFGYGQAALTLASRFRVALWTEEGLPTIGGQLRLPIRFDYSAPAAAAKP